MNRMVKVNFNKETSVITDEMIYPYKRIKKVSIPSSVNKIYDGAFNKKKHLTNVYFEEYSKVARIPDLCFANCINLETINLPSDLISIGSKAFLNCNSLKELYLPKSVIDVHPDAFHGFDESQTVYTHIKLKKPITSKFNIVYIEEDNQAENEEFINRKEGYKYYLVTAKCGHLGRSNYIPISFPVRSLNMKEASNIARMIPRVKKHHIDVILGIEQVSYERFQKQILINNEDPYLQLTNSRDQKRVYHLFEHRIKKEKNTNQM